MKSSNVNSLEDTPKTSQSKGSKKSTKSRSKNTKSDSTSGVAKGSSSAAAATNSIPATPTNINIVTTPTTPTTSTSNYNFFDASFAGTGNSTDTLSGNNKQSHNKSYAGLEPCSVKIMWEQHDQTDLELSQEVCARVAEDASYKLWELINNIKTYARHSGGIVTYDLVNEVLKDADVPPVLGAMDSDWERVDYDGSFFFHSDKVLELRDEYQKEVNFSLPDGPDFVCTTPLDDKHLDQLKQYIPNLIFTSLYGDVSTQRAALAEAVTSSLMGACYRAIVAKVVHVLVFKQEDTLSQRCWRLLRACNDNPFASNIHCREEYFHLAEILTCQLLAPFETIKTHGQKPSTESGDKLKTNVEKIDQLDNEEKTEPFTDHQTQSEQQSAETGAAAANNTENCRPAKLELVDDSDDVEIVPTAQQMSPCFACPVGAAYVDELCETIGHLASQNGYLLSECLYLIKRRLERYFDNRDISSDRDYNYISRAVRGLIALGEYAFREFIPYMYKLKVDDMPDSLWQNFIVAAVFLNGRDDIYLYEWLEYGCGADKLQPFMVHLAMTHEKHLISATTAPKANVFKICSIVGTRRLEWSTLAAAMCLGDDPCKALKPKPSLQDVFPELVTPNLELNRSGTIRFKFAGCRPMLLKPKGTPNSAAGLTSPSANGPTEPPQSDIIIARRKLFKPLTNVRTAVPVCSFYYTKIN